MTESTADRFLHLACLAYDDVGPAEWTEARALLADNPEIVDGGIHVAAVAGDSKAIDDILRADPTAATRAGGPKGWEPLLYLAYARHDPTISEDTVLAAARRLLSAGADPNAGFVLDGLDIPFTVLTGVFGHGELGPIRQPAHPHALALGRLLLEAGAEPEDAQTLYNRMFEPSNDHLELLLEFGLGTRDGALLRSQLAWAISHGMVDRVALLADHGVDLVAPMDESLARLVAQWAAIDGDSATPAVTAALTGQPEVISYLVEHGIPIPTLTPGGAFVAAALAADRVEVERLQADHPDLVDHVRTTRPGLMAWAASTGRDGPVDLLVELGFDVNAMGRTDMPGNQPWQTALHKAVEDDDPTLARTLLALGAGPDIVDQRFRATPLGWAQHFGHDRLVELLEPLTTLEGGDVSD